MTDSTPAATPIAEGIVARAARALGYVVTGDADPKLLPQPLAEIDEPPALDPVHRSDRSGLDHRDQRRAVRVVQPTRLAGRLAVDQAVGSLGIELQHPIANDLKCHATDLGSLGPRRPIIDCSQRQKAARLSGILRLPCCSAQPRRVKITPKRNRHGEPPSFATFESHLGPIRESLSSPHESRTQRLGIRHRQSM